MTRRALPLAWRVRAPAAAFCLLMAALAVGMVWRSSANVHASTALIERQDRAVIAARDWQLAVHDLAAASDAAAARAARARSDAAQADAMRLLSGDASAQASAQALSQAVMALATAVEQAQPAAVAAARGPAIERAAAFAALQVRAEDALRAEVAKARLGITHAIFVLALAIIAGTVVATQFLVRTLVRPVGELVAFAQRLAARDLGSDVVRTRGDELGDLQQALSEMRGALATMVDHARDGADQVQRAAHEIAAGNGDLSQRTEAAAAELQQTASVVAELGDTVRRTAERAREADALARDAARMAGGGADTVAEAVTTMRAIHDSSRRIADITGVIDGIAFQTNILALNASVEASRAGEQGRGFAVVAAEVRQLAQRSAEAAREIKGLIGSSVERVEDGARLVGTAGDTIGELVTRVRDVSEAIAGITQDSASQSERLASVAEAMGHLDRMSQSNAAQVEQSAAAAESLKAQAEGLHRLVSGYRAGAVPVA